jgi:broad specificity phosphatase PhoE
MTQNRIIFLRHADTQKDPEVHATLWDLSESGKIEAEHVKDIEIMNAVDVIYTSEERKTSLTVQPLAGKLGKISTPMAAFNEVARGEKFLSKEEFEQEKNRQLEDLEYAAFNGESGLDALARFKAGVKEVAETNPGKTILIVTHGTVLNIYFSELLGANSSLPDRWSKTGFCAYGIVEDGEVVRDII